MNFTKMHGLGNDYIYVYGEPPENVAELSKRLSDRHFGIGSDGMIFIEKSKIADFKMRIFNADGSEAMMCGNGIRCVGKFVYDKSYTDKTELSVDTLSGVKKLKLYLEGKRVKSVLVDMGKAQIAAEKEITAESGSFKLIPVSMGNPHAVVFTDSADSVPLGKIGPEIEGHECFPDGVNVEFVSKISENALRMRVWERGSGVTMACGTGACAAASAAVKQGVCRVNTPIKLVLDGGELEITVSDDFTVSMKGSAETVFEGRIEDM